MDQCDICEEMGCRDCENCSLGNPCYDCEDYDRIIKNCTSNGRCADMMGEKDSGLSILQLLFDSPNMKMQEEYCTRSYCGKTMKIRKIGIPKLTAYGWSIDWISCID